MAYVLVGTDSTDLSFRRRVVELQRYTGTRWVRVRRAKLARSPRPTTFIAAFGVPTRGLTLRVFAPAATAAPCFKPNVSKTWRS